MKKEKKTLWPISSSAFGTPTSISRSRRPALRSAGSIASGRFVAPNNTTLSPLWTPSKAVRKAATILYSVVVGHLKPKMHKNALMFKTFIWWSEKEKLKTKHEWKPRRVLLSISLASSRLGQTASTSSMNSNAPVFLSAACCLQLWKAILILSSDSPRPVPTRSVAANNSHGHSNSSAKLLANNVFPVPGGPYKRTPLGGVTPMRR